MDYIIKNPFQIIRIAPNMGTVLTLATNKIPADIKSELNYVFNHKSQTSAILKKFYGPNWRNIIGLTNSEIFGGDISVDMPIEFPEPELKFHEFAEEPEIPDEKLELVDETQNKSAIIHGLEHNLHADVELPVSGQIKYIQSNIIIFPEDRISELKEKIFIATGIPMYRQHLFWINESDTAIIPYKIKTQDGGDIYVDTRALFVDSHIKQENQQKQEKQNGSRSRQENTVFGLQLDQYIHDNINNITIIALDTFKTVEDLLVGITNKLYVIDLTDLLAPTKGTLTVDKIRRDLIYKSVIYKYYPWLSEDVFNLYLTNEMELYHNYSLLAIPRQKLQDQYKIEADIILSATDAIRHLDIAITMAVANISTGCRIHIRNLFDKFKTSLNYPFVSAYINDKAIRYNIKKHHIGTPNIIFPPPTQSGLTVAIPIDPEELYSRNITRLNVLEGQLLSKLTYIFFNIQADGAMYILSHWGDEEKMDFDKLFYMMQEKVNPLIDIINKLIDYVFIGVHKQLPMLSKINIRYPNLTISLFWKKMTNEIQFKELKNIWKEYEDAGILWIRPTAIGGLQTASILEMFLLKGTVEYDINKITHSPVLSKVKNYYTHLTDAKVHEVWNNMYSGRLIKMNHRTSDIKFDLFNVTQSNYLRFQRYLNVYISAANRRINKLGGVSESTHIRKLRKLQETDPDLYNMRKYGTNKLYAVLCQEQRQPMIYNKPEDAPRKLKLTKYVNFTTGQPAYYGCTDKEHSVMSFITGVHPLGYCLPCCKKRNALLGTMRDKEQSLCLSEGKIEPGQLSEFKVQIEPGKFAPPAARHVISWGKEIPLMRLGRLPHTVGEYFKEIGLNKLEKDNNLQKDDNLRKNIDNKLEKDNDNNSHKNISNALEKNQTDLYLVGIRQNYPGITNAGALAALALVLNISTKQLAGRFIKQLKIMGIGFETLLNGEIIDWFNSVDELIGTIHKLFVIEEIGMVYFKNWLQLFTELFRIMESIDVTIITTGETISSEIEFELIHENTIVLILDNDSGNIYPVAQIDIGEYFKDMKVKKLLFESSTIATSLAVSIPKPILSYEDVFKAMSIFEDVAIQITPQRIAYGISGFLPNKIIKELSENKELSKELPDKIIKELSENKESPKESNIAEKEELPKELPETKKEELSETKKEELSETKKEELSKESKDNMILITMEPTIAPRNLPTTNRELNIGYSAKLADVVRKLSKNITNSEIKNNDNTIQLFVNNKPILTGYFTAPGELPPIFKILAGEKSGESSDNLDNVLTHATVKHNIYNQLLMEITFYLDKNRNTDMRRKVIKLIDDFDIDDIQPFNKKLKELNIDGTDINYINSIISMNLSGKGRINHIKIAEEINKNKFRFDKNQYDKLFKMPRDELIIEVKKIMSAIIIETDELSPLTNLSLPAALSGNKLPIKKDDVTTFIELLTDDIKNPLKIELMKSGALSSFLLLNLFDFEKNQNEIIRIETI